MKQVLRRRGSDAVRKERNATINMTAQAEMLQREAAEMEAYYKEIEEAYVDHGHNLDRTSGGNYLAVLREKYGTLLQQVRELDGGKGLSAHLLTLPEVGKLLPLKWEEQPHPTRKTPIKVFTPGAGQKRNMLAGGWTQDRFLKMMYQIPEMSKRRDSHLFRR